MTESIQVLAGYAIAEAQIENLVTAKGYADCVAFMGDGSISVVVDAPADVISSLSGRRGMLPGISTKTVYSKLTQKSEEETT